MKKILLLISLITIFALSGCDFLNNSTTTAIETTTNVQSTNTTSENITNIVTSTVDNSTTEIPTTINPTTTGPTTEALHEVSFESNGGTLIDSQFVASGSTIDLPIPTQEGYTFMGWFTGEGVNDTQFSVLSIVTRNLTLYAKWTINQYTLTFYDNNSYFLTSITLDYGETIQYPSFELEGYFFGGWFISSECIDEFVYDVMPSSDYSLYPKITANIYTVTYYNYDETTVLFSTNVKYGNAAVYNGETPEKLSSYDYDYIFNGWSVSFDFVYDDIDVYAIFLEVESKVHLADRITCFLEQQINDYENLDFNINIQFEDITLSVTSSEEQYVSISETEFDDIILINVLRPYIPDGGIDTTITLNASYTYLDEQQIVNVDFIVQAEEEYTVFQSIQELYNNAVFDDYVKISATVNFKFLTSFFVEDNYGEELYIEGDPEYISGLQVGSQILICGHYVQDQEIAASGKIIFSTIKIENDELAIPSINRILLDYSDVQSLTDNSNWIFGRIYDFGSDSGNYFLSPYYLQDLGLLNFGIYAESDFVTQIGYISKNMTQDSVEALEYSISENPGGLISFIFFGYNEESGKPIFLFDNQINLKPILGIIFVNIATDIDYLIENNYELPEGVIQGLYIFSVTPERTFDSILLVNDILLSINGNDIIDGYQLLFEILPQLRVGGYITIEIIREGILMTITDVLVVG